MPIYLKSRSEIERMRTSGQIVREVLDAVEAATGPGVSTLQLNEVAEKTLAQWKDATPAFLGYQGFPAALCASINEEVVHGIPSQERILEDGDIISVDYGARYQGFYGDSARTIPVGEISDEARKLIDVTREALVKGIEQCVVGKHLSDIAKAVQTHAEIHGYSVVRKFVGHGIGRAMHEDPQVPNYWNSTRTGLKLREGMVLAIEPMVNVGTFDVKILSDSWTVVTKDRKLSAHFEHTVALTANGPEILTGES